MAAGAINPWACQLERLRWQEPPNELIKLRWQDLKTAQLVPSKELVGRMDTFDTLQAEVQCSALALCCSQHCACRVQAY